MELIRTIKEVTQFSFLLQQTVVREIRVRYKQTVVGLLWAILQPLFYTLIFFFIFAAYRQGMSQKEHFAILFFSTSFWTFFSNSISFATTSISGHPALVTKVYFPRLVFPLSFVTVSLIDLAINLSISLILYLVLIGTWPSLYALLLATLAVLTLVIFTASLAILIAGLNVFYRDFRYLIPLGLQFLMFMTPVIYTMDQVPNATIAKVLHFNPLTTIMESIQGMLLGQAIPTQRLLLIFAITLVMTELSLRLFRKFNTKMADLI